MVWVDDLCGTTFAELVLLRGTVRFSGRFLLDGQKDRTVSHGRLGARPPDISTGGQRKEESAAGQDPNPSSFREAWRPGGRNGVSARCQISHPPGGSRRLPCGLSFFPVAFESLILRIERTQVGLCGAVARQLLGSARALAGVRKGVEAVWRAIALLRKTATGEGQHRNCQQNKNLFPWTAYHVILDSSWNLVQDAWE